MRIFLKKINFYKKRFDLWHQHDFGEIKQFSLFTRRLLEMIYELQLIEGAHVCKVRIAASSHLQESARDHVLSFPIPSPPQRGNVSAAVRVSSVEVGDVTVAGLWCVRVCVQRELSARECKGIARVGSGRARGAVLRLRGSLYKARLRLNSRSVHSFVHFD